MNATLDNNQAHDTATTAPDQHTSHGIPPESAPKTKADGLFEFARAREAREKLNNATTKPG